MGVMDLETRILTICLEFYKIEGSSQTLYMDDGCTHSSFGKGEVIPSHVRPHQKKGGIYARETTQKTDM